MLANAPGPRRFALIAAAGASTRFGTPEAKQYAMIAGVPMLARTIASLQSPAVLDGIFVVIAAGDTVYAQRIGEIEGVVALRCGARTRAESVKNGLAAMANDAAAEDWVLVHDAARPCLDVDSLLRLMRELEGESVGGLLAVPLADTLKRTDNGFPLRSGGTASRSGLWCAQTPQMFRYALLRRALDACDLAAITDEAQAVEALGLKPRLVQGSPANVKVTYPHDLELAAAILASRQQDA